MNDMPRLEIEGTPGQVIAVGRPNNNWLLRQKSRETTAEEVASLDLVNRMLYALERAWTPGVGLAAIQIGVDLRFSIYRLPIEGQTTMGPLKTLMNPAIVGFSREVICHHGEGCLSIPNYRPSPWRHSAVRYQHTVDGKTVRAMAFGLEAVIIQHEVDHMDGILCTDRLKKPLEPGPNNTCSCGSGKKFKKCCRVTS